MARRGGGEAAGGGGTACAGRADGACAAGNGTSGDGGLPGPDSRNTPPTIRRPARNAPNISNPSIRLRVRPSCLSASPCFMRSRGSGSLPLVDVPQLEDLPPLQQLHRPIELGILDVFLPRLARSDGVLPAILLSGRFFLLLQGRRRGFHRRGRRLALTFPLQVVLDVLFPQRPRVPFRSLSAVGDDDVRLDPLRLDGPPVRGEISRRGQPERRPVLHRYDRLDGALSER